MSIIRQLHDTVEKNVDAQKSFVKTMLCMMLGEERGLKRYPVLEKLMDNTEVRGAPTLVGKAILDMTDEEFQTFQQLSTESQLQSIIKPDNN